MHEGRLKISAVANQPITDFGRFARSMVFQSQAITPTTSIANVQHMSNTVFQTLLNKPEDIKLNISDALATKYKFKEGSGILTYIGKPSDVQIAMGIDPNVHTPGYYLLSNISQTGQQASQSAGTYVRVSDQTATERMIGKILGEARKGDAGATTPIQLQTKGGAVITKKVNLEATSIIGTGWNYSQASAVNELEHIGRLNIKTTGRFTQDEAIDAFSSVFKQLGSGLSPSDQMRFIAGKDTLGSPFQAGMSNYSLDVAKSIAQKFAKIGDPFAYMSMTDRVFSTIVAESTTGLANFANASGARAGYAAADLAFTATPKVTSGLGISVFQSTTTARLLDASVSDVAVRKMILPQRILKEATAQIDPNLSMSKIYLSSSQTKQNKVMVNAVWDARRQLGETQSRSLMENIFDIMTDKQKVASLLGKDEAELDSKIVDQINFLVAQKSQGKKMQAVEEMLGSLSQEGGGIIFANAGDESANLAVALERAGFPIENANDVFLRNKYATALTTGLSEDFVALSPFIEEKATETVKLAKDAAKAATEVVDVNGKKVSRAIQSANRIAESLSTTEGGTRVLIGRLNRAKMGMGPNKMLDFYNFHKPKVGIALGAVALAGIGYYISKKYRERQLYDETLQQQPMESARQLDPNAQAKLAPPVLSLNSIRRDPLTTAGVVGNLDRAKIGHTKMGPGKDNHLFGGAI